MRDALDLGARGQNLVEMAAPPRRVLPLAVTAHLRPVEDKLYPSTDARRGLRRRRPDRLQDLEHKPGVDRPHRQIIDQRRCRGIDPPAAPRLIERREPLICMLRISPSRPVGLYVPVGALLETDRLGRLEPFLGPLAPSCAR